MSRNTSLRQGFLLSFSLSNLSFCRPFHFSFSLALCLANRNVDYCTRSSVLIIGHGQVQVRSRAHSRGALTMEARGECGIGRCRYRLGIWQAGWVCPPWSGEVAWAHQSKKLSRLTITRLLRFIDGACAEKSQTGSTDRIFLIKKAAQMRFFWL